MVSFQCDGCADVVKKPKLDQHRSRCGASFTCIDCSKTFPTPVDWKGHTSCISEAEKYQKSLYKPKPNGGGGENPYGNGSGGKFQGRGGPWSRPPPRSQATGANGTPLGTPPRMSPVTAPPLQDEKSHTAVSDTAIEPVSKEEPKKHKKRKSEATNVAHVEAVTQGADDPISREEPKEKERKDKKTKEGEKKKKKSKEGKEKKDKHEKAVAPEEGANGVDPLSVSPPLPVDVTGDERPKKAKKDKKEKKDRPGPAIQTEGASNGVDPASLSPLLPPDVPGDEKSEKSKKKRKHKETKRVETGGGVQDVPVETPSVDVDTLNGEEQKKKKRKSKIASGEPVVNGEVDAIPLSTEKKKKKRKLEVEEQEDVVGQETATERKKKKKKVAVQ